jgi:membrane protein DedA with SNARE-associated domain
MLPDKMDKRDWIKKKFIPLLALLLVIAISVTLFFYGRNPETVAQLGKYRYLGAFLISLIGNASVLLPGIVLPILTALGIDFYQASGWLLGPILIGLAGGIGAAIGEMTGYMVGYSGHGIVKRSKMYNRVEGWMRRWGAVTIFILSLVPFFFDLVGIAAGVLRFPPWKFFLLCWSGRTLLYVGFILLAAIWGWETLLPYFG